LAERDVLSIHSGSRIRVLLHDCAFDGHAGKCAFETSVGQHFGVHLPVGTSGSMAPHRPCRSGALVADLEFTRKEVPSPFVAHYQHYEVHTFNSDLKSPGAATHEDESWSAPPVWCATAGDA